MGVTLPSIDRMLAKIDRELAPPFQLPVGGPVRETYWGCWADLYRPHHNMTYTCGSPVEDWERSQGLCAVHHLEMTDGA